MITQEYIDYLKSDTWQRLRSKRLAIDGYKCQRCGRPFDLQVHHLAYPLELGTEDPYRDLITLCDTCHELVEHQKKTFRKDKKDAIVEQRQYELREIYRTIKREACYDLSALGMGTLDFCNIDVIKAHFGPLFDGKIEMMGYVSRVQDYFRDQRYRIILGMMDIGLTPREVCERTKFSWNMVSKVFANPDSKREILKKAREKEYYAEADEL